MLVEVDWPPRAAQWRSIGLSEERFAYPTNRDDISELMGLLVRANQKVGHDGSLMRMIGDSEKKQQKDMNA